MAEQRALLIRLSSLGDISASDIVVRTSTYSETAFQREASYSKAMQSLTIEPVGEAIQRPWDPRR